MPLPVTALVDPSAYPDLTGREAVTVVVFGDSGVAETFPEVASAAAKTCFVGREHPCDLGLLLGDNVYPSGMEAPADALWQAAFARPMAPFVERARSDARFRVWVVAGNHDWNHRVNEEGERRIQAAIDTTGSAANTAIGHLWQEPALQFSVPGLPPWLNLVGVDTETVVSGGGGEVLAALNAATRASPEPAWDVVFGHHVPASTGPHAADPEERDDETWAAALDLVRPAGLDLVLAGHDHHQEFLVSAGLPIVVMGSSSKGRDVVEGPYAPCSRWSRAGTAGLGFAIVTFTRERAVLEFFDVHGNVVHREDLQPSTGPVPTAHVGSCG